MFAIDPNKPNSLSNRYKISVKKKTHAKSADGISGATTVFVHEAMHAIDYSLRDDPNGVKCSDNEDIKRLYQAEIDAFFEKRPELRENFEQWRNRTAFHTAYPYPYAWWNVREFVAERCTEALTNPAEASENARAVLARMKELYAAGVKARQQGDR